MPRHCSADSPPLCDTVRHGQQPPRSTLPSTPVRPAHRTLEKGRRNPQREDARLLRARTGWRRDVRLAPERSPPSPSALCDHPGHCITILDVVEARGNGTPPHQPLCLVRPNVNGTIESSCGWPSNEQPLRHPLPPKPLLDAHRTRHDASPEAGFARTVVCSVALYAKPPHIARTIWHACKLLPPWSIKGGAVP
jgi:hypothetical protein